ncbi:MAG: ATP-binding cassette domain-containing protein [Kiritimatiellae bacterium]|nr:ATP-binding cassette domain-containing protein [Kiritimatiellia bacterium]
MKQTSTSPAIRFVNVTKSFGGPPVLDSLSFDIARGETFVIVGASGSGKSVTLKHMVRLLIPDSGVVYVNNEPISEAEGTALERLRDRFGYLFQGAALIAWLNVFENVALPLREKTDLGEHEIREKVFDTLKLVGLENDAEKEPDQISGGMRKRVGLARAIVRNPEIVLYDEPTSGLDPVSARMIDALIAKMQGELGVTSVVVTHDLHSALSIGSRIAMLQGGRMIEPLPPEEFVRSTHPEVRAFLASQFITTKGVWEKTSK